VLVHPIVGFVGNRNANVTIHEVATLSTSYLQQDGKTPWPRIANDGEGANEMQTFERMKFTLE